ncbi:MAG: EamA family transporter [Candidatus Aenigmarchaeota archaeon]|nr:EamA family transporter [Candidatus Aenigmarchaeota archaeon]
MALEPAIAAALGAMIFWGVGDFLIQRSARKMGDLAALAVVGLVGSLGLAPLVLPELALLSLPALGLLLLLGGLTFVVGAMDFEALREGKLAVVDVVLEIELPFTVLLAFLLFQETFSLLETGIMALLFVGIILMATSRFSFRRKSLEKGVALAGLTALGMALVNFLTAAGARQASPLLAIWIPWLVFTSICLVTISKRQGLGRFWKDAGRFRTLAVGMGIADTAAWVFYALAVEGTRIGLATAITEAYPAVALVLALLINKERISLHQALGGSIALASSLVLAVV